MDYFIFVSCYQKRDGYDTPSAYVICDLQVDADKYKLKCKDDSKQADWHGKTFSNGEECMKICEKIQTKVEQYLKDKSVTWWRKTIKEAKTFDNVELKLRIPKPKGFVTDALLEYKYEPSRDEC